MSVFRRTAEQEIYQGAVITLGVGTFVGPDGQPFERDVVHHPGAVSVVPLIDDEFVLVRQYRAAPIMICSRSRPASATCPASLRRRPPTAS